ncbi:CDF family zinc transporter CzcD [Barrientosiimonas marina]|uniref:Cation diffusion facilitator family transporter n=1 Tax=Lentibacillus kimchii TaxID=1542911 RepID=A0ABW2UQE9_9BACI
MAHDHDHSHNHTHSHDHAHGANKKALMISFLIIFVYMLVEVVGGFLSGSLALLSDAGHMLSDAASLGVGLLAFKFGEKNASYEKTYGYKRFEILAAVFNGAVLIVISLLIFYEAFQRFMAPPEVASTGMLVVACIGLIVNLVVARVLHGGDKDENLNMRAAFLHVLGDLLGSIGAVTAAILIMLFDWTWADPLASVIVAILVLISGWRVTKDAVHVLMEGTPENVELDDIIKTIENIPDVISIHDLHVWSIRSGQNALSCHAVVDGHLSVYDSQKLLQTIEHEMAHKEIGHVTVQMESEQHPHDGSLFSQDDRE